MSSFESASAGSVPVDVFTVSVDAGNGTGIQVFDRVFWTAGEANAAARLFFDNWAQTNGAPDWENGLTNGGNFQRGEVNGNAFWHGQVHGNKVKVEVLRSPIPQGIPTHEDVASQDAAAAAEAGMANFTPAQADILNSLLPDATDLSEFAEAAAAVERSDFASENQHQSTAQQEQPNAGVQSELQQQQEQPQPQNNGSSSPNSLIRKAESSLLSESPEAKKARMAPPPPHNGITPQYNSPVPTPKKRGPRPYADRMPYTNSPSGTPGSFRSFNNYGAQLPDPAAAAFPALEGMLQVWNWSIKGYGETMELATLGCHIGCKLKYIQVLTTKALVIRNFLQAADLNFIEITHNFMINNVGPACEEFKKLAEGKASKIKFYVSKMEHKSTFYFDDLTDEEVKGGYAWWKRGNNGVRQKVYLRKPLVDGEVEEEEGEEKAPKADEAPVEQAQPQAPQPQHQELPQQAQTQPVAIQQQS